MTQSTPPKSFEQMAAEAQKEMESWPKERRDAVQLQGVSNYPYSEPVSQSTPQPTQAPEIIYLQTGCDECDDAFQHDAEMTWCKDAQHDNDTKYIRFDEHDRALEQARAEKERAERDDLEPHPCCEQWETCVERCIPLVMRLRFGMLDQKRVAAEGWNRATAAESRERALREALAELVRLKGLKERAEAGEANADVLLEVYEQNKEKAWLAARAALETKP